MAKSIMGYVLIIIGILVFIYGVKEALLEMEEEKIWAKILIILMEFLDATSGVLLGSLIIIVGIFLIL